MQDHSDQDRFDQTRYYQDLPAPPPGPPPGFAPPPLGYAAPPPGYSPPSHGYSPPPQQRPQPRQRMDRYEQSDSESESDREDARRRNRSRGYGSGRRNDRRDDGYTDGKAYEYSASSERDYQSGRGEQPAGRDRNAPGIAGAMTVRLAEPTSVSVRDSCGYGMAYWQSADI
jgi:hypothetical protein